MATPENMIGVETFDTGVPVDREGQEASREEDPERIVGSMIDEALQWREENLDPKLEQATDYYKARPFGNEEKGRSQVVDTAVRDTVQAVMPALLKFFFGPDSIVAFKPDHPDKVALAESMTKQVEFVIAEDNPGFLTFHGMLKDALIRKLGVIKYWWDDRTEVLGSHHSNLTAEAIALLQMNPDIEIEFLEEGADEELIEGQSETFEVHIKRVKQDGRARFEVLPPEEWIFSPSARSLDDARMVGHVRDVPASELVAMGVSRDQVAKHRGKSGKSPRGENTGSTLEAARRIEGFVPSEDEQSEATRDVTFGEIYVKLDLDEDGIAELHKIWVIGDNWEWARDEDGEVIREVVDEKPFALFGPDPEAHSMIGLSLADYVMDLQRINSALTRGTLDSLYQHLRPSQEVVEGEVNLHDLKNPEVGRFVRVTQPGMVREIPTDFVGADALPVLQHFDNVRQERTGISKAATGLDPDSLQSSTRAAVAATVNAAKERTEMIARILAETGMKQLFMGIAKLLQENQTEARMIQIAGEFVEMDPQSWDLNMDVTVSVGLGSGMTDQKLNTLIQIAEKQEAQLQAGSPLVGFREYRNTLSRITKLAGFEQDTEFWKPFGEEEEQAFQQQQAQAAQEPTTEEQLVKVEMAKIQQKHAEAMAKLQLEAQKMSLEDDRKRDEIVRDFETKLAELGVEIEESQLQAARDALDADLDRADKELGIIERLANIELGGSSGQESS